MLPSFPCLGNFDRGLGGRQATGWPGESGGMGGKEHTRCGAASWPLNLDRQIISVLLLKQMTVDQWKNLIQHAVLKPEVSKYLFYNSRALGITITVVLYVTLWLNLYSTLITFAAGKPWVVSIVVTLVSLVAALTIRLITLRYQSKVRRGWIYTALDFQSGSTARRVLWDSTTGEWGLTLFFQFLQLWFVHFDVGPCLHSLTDAVAEMKRNQELALKRRLDELRIVIETTILPGLEEKPESSVEESPLLSERRKSSRNAVTFQDFLHLLPEGPPEAMAEQLLTIYSGYYIRLLVSGQLPSIATGRHIALGRAPCLCQFVEKVVLGKQES
uniref:Transmembrane protein 268 n=1 Tax=Varanus komodoensis TaxID=61221 RepID=A0A8D2LNP9_VARKO